MIITSLIPDQTAFGFDFIDQIANLFIGEY